MKPEGKEIEPSLDSFFVSRTFRLDYVELRRHPVLVGLGSGAERLLSKSVPGFRDLSGWTEGGFELESHTSSFRASFVVRWLERRAQKCFLH